MDFHDLARQCAPQIHPTTLQAVVRTESGFNPYAIGVVGGRLVRQPRNLAEAAATARALDARGINFSMGLGQINKANLASYGLTYDTVFDLCANLRAGGSILQSCYTRALARLGERQALQAALSCYYSGNFTRGFKTEGDGKSYVQRVLAKADAADKAAPPTVPAIPVVLDRQPPSGESGAPGSRTAAPPKTQPRPQATGASQPAKAGWDAFGDFAGELSSSQPQEQHP